MAKTNETYTDEEQERIDEVIDQQENYKKSGFQLAYRNIRYKGIGGGYISQHVVDLKKVSFEDLVAYDTTLFSEEQQTCRLWCN